MEDPRSSSIWQPSADQWQSAQDVPGDPEAMYAAMFGLPWGGACGSGAYFPEVFAPSGCWRGEVPSRPRSARGRGFGRQQPPGGTADHGAGKGGKGRGAGKGGKGGKGAGFGGGGRGSKGGAAHGRSWQGASRGEGPAEAFRSAVLSLRRAPDLQSAQRAADALQAALVEVEAGNDRLDGALIGMAAAQASRWALRKPLEALCAFSWSRLGQYGGREVAELVAAAAKHGCGDHKFYHFVGAFCHDKPSSFGCLRDVALMAATLVKKASLDHSPGSGPKLDSVGAFHDLALAALPHLRSADGGQLGVRDVAEVLYSLAHMMDRKPVDGRGMLQQSDVCIEAISTSVAVARRGLHQATAQDIAKLAGAVATMWPLLPRIQSSTLEPFVLDLSQAVRFRARDFNSKDVCAIVVAFAKLDTSGDILGEVLFTQVQANASTFAGKDLSLFLWACSRPGWVGKMFSELAIAELQQRDLSSLLVVDLCMVVQALAKLGPPAKAGLCLVAGECFARQLQGFSTADKSLLLWSLAKSRVVHMALCRLLVRSLAAENCAGLQRDVVSATLWAVAVIHSRLPLDEEDEWPRKLTRDLCRAQPWRACSSFEVANAAWACAQLPCEWTEDFWPSLVSCTERLQPAKLTVHELCNLLSGMALFSTRVPCASAPTAEVLSEVMSRARNDGRSANLTGHDKRSLSGMLGTLESLGPLPDSFEKLSALIRGPGDHHRQVTKDPDYASGPAAVDQGDRQADHQVWSACADCAAGACSSAGCPVGAAPPPPLVTAPRLHGSGDNHACHSHAEAAPSGRRITSKHHIEISVAGHGANCHGHGLTHGEHSCSHGHAHEHHVHTHGLPESPDLTPRHPGVGHDHDKHWTVHHHGACGDPTCCLPVESVSFGNELRVNQHCNFKGHCVQLRNTFIHVECNHAEGDDEDCALCGASRQRARSAENLRPPADAVLPGGSPALRPHPSPRHSSDCGSTEDSAELEGAPLPADWQ